MQPTSPTTTVDDGRVLRIAAVAFTAAVLFHNSDHVRRGADAVADDVFWAGSLSLVLEVAIVALVFLGHRVAPLFAATSGLALAAGYVLVHVLPGRSWLSDPLFDGGADGVSQLAASLEVLTSLAVGVAGLLVLRARGGLASAADDRWNAPGAWTRVATHPVVVAMAVGNLVILVLSLADR